MFRWLQRFRERGTKGYCYEDLWSFDNWLSATIARGLREFKAITHTYPNDLNDWDAWMATLDEMIDCFEEQGRNIENADIVDYFERYKARERNRREKLHRGMELLERYWYDLWD